MDEKLVFVQQPLLNTHNVLGAGEMELLSPTTFLLLDPLLGHLSQPALWVCDPCNRLGPDAQKSPTMGV